MPKVSVILKKFKTKNNINYVGADLYSKSTKTIIIGSAVAGSLAAVMLIIAAILYWKNRRDRRYLLLAVHESMSNNHSTFLASDEISSFRILLLEVALSISL